MPPLNSTDFSLAFESTGTSFVFEDFVARHYVAWKSVVIRRGNRTRVFHHVAAIEQMRSAGIARTVDDTRSIIEALETSITKAQTEIAFCRESPTFEEGDLARMCSILETFGSDYNYFEAAYWDGAYAQSASDALARANVAMVQDYKNVVREKLNGIFFGSESFLELMLGRIARHAGIPTDELFEYAYVELADAYRGVWISPQILEARKQGFAIYSDAPHIESLYGAEADAFAAVFDPVMETTARSCKGAIAFKSSRVQAPAYVMSRDYGDDAKMRELMRQMPKGSVLVTETTDPGMMEAFYKASAVVTNIGGMLSHAAITSRELKIPCVVGTEIGTQIFKTGDMLVVDTDTGIVTIAHADTV